MASGDQDFVVVEEKDVQDFNPEGVLPLPDYKILQIQKFLEPTEYSATSSEWSKHRISHLSGTGTWILDTDQYRQWHDSSQGGLWIKGVAGAGKSVIAATLVSKLAADEKVPVLYFFFRHIISANQKPKSLACDFLSQILQYSPQLQHELFKFTEKDRRPVDSVSLDELWGMLLSSLGRFPRVYCIIDALDEMDTVDEGFPDKLVALTHRLPASIKVLVTSRPIPRIESHFRNADLIQLVLQPHLVNPDISFYVRHRLSQHTMSPVKSALIHDTVCKKAEGHFLYARLMMDDLLDPRKDVVSDEQRLSLALNKLPVPMEDMYTQMLLEHSQRSGTPQDLQVILLQWITQAERPLRLLELSSLIDITDYLPQVNKDAKSVIREACGPLLEFFEDETVHPIHHSFTEFLYDKNRLNSQSSSLRFPVLHSEEAQRTLGIKCLQRLVSGWHTKWLVSAFGHDRDKTTSRESGDRNTLRLSFPYLDYVAANWDYHLHKSRASDDDLVTALHKILTEDADLLHAWLEWKIRKEPISFPCNADDDLGTWSPLHAAAQTGIAFFAELLVHQGCDIDQWTNNGRTPLSLAAEHGHHSVVHLLLKRGAKNDEPDDFGMKPLHYAARANRSEVVRLLLEVGISPRTPKTKEWPNRHRSNGTSSVGECPLEYACRSGHVDTIKVMIPSLSSDDLQQALYWALVSGKTEVTVEILQCPDIQVNCLFKNRTPLFFACRARDITIMRLLLDMGADVNTLSDDYIGGDGMRIQQGAYGGHVSPLHTFIGRNHNDGPLWGMRLEATVLWDGVLMLLNAGIDPNIVDVNGLTVLHAMMISPMIWHENNAETIEMTKTVLTLLLDRGLSPESVTKDGSSALHMASEVTTDILDILIDRGVDIDAIRKSDGQTPLMTAVAAGQLINAQHLVRRGANVNAIDNKGNTVLHFTGRLNRFGTSTEMVRMLIAAGIDPNTRNKDGNTALHVAEHSPDTISVFLQNGFDLESKNRLGQTLLFQSALNKNGIYYSRSLIKLGADPLTRDKQGRTLLHIVHSTIANTAVELSQFYVDKGADPHSTDSEGNSLWHVVAGVSASDYYEWAALLPIMKLLMAYKVSPAATNLAGQTPLHIAFSTDGNWASHGPVEFLLEHTRIGVEVADHDQVRPLHLAVSYDFKLVHFLLERGADCTAVTMEGQTPLMVACRTRQSNIVCILLDHYRQKDILHLIDQMDRNGRTALHHACQSGRPETVALLLKAGASVNLEDENNATSLHACGTYHEEDALWTRCCELQTDPRGTIGAAYVLSTDSARPEFRQQLGMPPPDPIRVRETIRLLVEHGADTAFLTDETEEWTLEKIHKQLSGNPEPINPLSFAILRACGPVVSELLLIREKLWQEKVELGSVMPLEQQRLSDDAVKDVYIRKPWSNKINPGQRLGLLTMHYMPDFIADTVESGQSTYRLVERLLCSDEEPSIRQIAERGAFFDLLKHEHENVLRRLAAWGFADLLVNLHEYVTRTATPRIGEMKSQLLDWDSDVLHGLLHAAFNRAIPNMSVVEIVVSKFRHDVNHMFSDMSDKPAMHTYAHMLARPSHWWQTKALAYILDNGAKVDLASSNGDTPLLVALRKSRDDRNEPARIRAVEILLEHNANPNATDRYGLTCLNIAAQQPKCVQLLFSHGADPSQGVRSFLMDAVGMQNIEIIKFIIASKADVNRQSQLIAPSEDQVRALWTRSRGGHPRPLPRSAVKEWSRSIYPEDLSVHAYPVHLAASKLLRLHDKTDRAQEVIELLLQGGANPFLTYENGSSILHCLAETDGTIEPFTTLPSFDTEIRDSQGRTLLLAACSYAENMFLNHSGGIIVSNNIDVLVNHGASITAVDNKGRNALHVLVDALADDPYCLRTARPNFEPFLSSLILRSDSSGRTPYHYAVSKRHVDLARLLLLHGSNPSVLDPSDNTTAFHHLVPELVEQGNNYYLKEFPRLLQGIVTRDFLDNKQCSLYHLLAWLLNNGPSINIPDISGETPVFKLARTGAFRADWHSPLNLTTGIGSLLCAFQILEVFGADLKVRNHTGESVLHHLAPHAANLSNEYTRNDRSHFRERDLQETVKWLVGKGLDVTWEDNQQRTCFDVAAASKSRWLAKLYEREQPDPV